MTDEPLIHTTRGNLPIASLDYSAEWHNTDDWLKLVETYRLDGEVVRQSVHVYGKRELALVPEQQFF